MPKPFKPMTESHKKLFVGLHRVRVKEFEYKKNDKGEIILNEFGGPSHITVEFENEQGFTRRKHFSLKQSALWVLENFSEAIRVKLVGDVEYDVERDVKGKFLYIVVVLVRITKGGVPIMENGRPKQYTDIKSRFYLDGNIEPTINGIPDDREPSGDYLEYREEWKGR
jgi:hypothetical protein